MGNQCCQSASIAQEDKDQISNSDKISKQKKNKSSKEQIDDKIDTHQKQQSNQFSKEDIYAANDNQEEPATNVETGIQNQNNQQNQQQQKSLKDKTKSIGSVKDDKQQQSEHQNGNSGNKNTNSENTNGQNQDQNNQNNDEAQKIAELKAQQEKQKEEQLKKEQEQQKKKEEQQKIEAKKAQEQKNKEQTENERKQSQKDKDKKGNSKPGTQKSSSQNPAQREKKPKQSIKEFNVSADLFIHLKQGNISDQYKICETLGEGAFGHVSKVIHKQSNLVRAMKCIKKSSLIKEEEQKMFSEMNILKNLDHPNIVRLYELYQDQKCYYLITEYCSGGELFDKIKSLTHFTEKMAAEYMKQLLSAIVYCHQNKIVHRDLKPENLILESEKKGAPIKVIDFGTSRKFENGKKMTKRLGTPYYIAPEVLGQKYDEKCDVWSCGVILYILLCGYPPFGGRTEEEILKKVKKGVVRFDPEDWDRVSQESKNLIKKMLTLDPKKRISTEQALQDPWVQKNAPQLPISSKALSSLSQFYTRSKLKQTIMTFIVSQLVSREEKDELQKTFRQLDKNGDGRLSKQELIEGYYKVYGNKEQAVQHVEKIMKMVDTNNSGVVDFTEFLMAAMQREQMLSKQKIETAFKLFDADGNGYITRDELQQIIGEIDDNFWKQILHECDTNKDGKISQQEFIELLIKKKI